MILRFPDDRLAQLAVSQGVDAVSSYRIAGTEGSIRVEPAYEYAEGLSQVVTIGEHQSRKKFPKRDQFAPELLYFSSCILEDREPEPSGVEGLADVRVMQAVIESAKSGMPVKLAPFERSQRPSLDQMIRRPPIHKPETVHAPSPSE
jgi:predicted dehydrogenase